MRMRSLLRLAGRIIYFVEVFDRLWWCPRFRHTATFRGGQVGELHQHNIDIWLFIITSPGNEIQGRGGN